jgi:hypothetical protein
MVPLCEHPPSFRTDGSADLLHGQGTNKAGEIGQGTNSEHEREKRKHLKNYLTFDLFLKTPKYNINIHVLILINS